MTEMHIKSGSIVIKRGDTVLIGGGMVLNQGCTVLIGGSLVLIVAPPDGRRKDRPCGSNAAYTQGFGWAGPFRS